VLCIQYVVTFVSYIRGYCLWIHELCSYILLALLRQAHFISTLVVSYVFLHYGLLRTNTKLYFSVASLRVFIGSSVFCPQDVHPKPEGSLNAGTFLMEKIENCYMFVLFTDLYICYMAACWFEHENCKRSINE
jgi:hypothetical protein